MRALVGSVVFTAGGETYRWEDVALAAMGWGDWGSLEAQVRAGLACVMGLADGEKDLDPDLVNAAADEFRYERDLITAEEAEAWLARWGLTPQSWMEYIQRSVLRQAWGDDLTKLEDQHPVTDAEVAAAIGAEGICSGALTRFARKLAGRAAAYERVREQAPNPPPGDALRAASRGSPTLAPTRIAATAGPTMGLAEKAWRERLLVLAQLEDAYWSFADQALTPKAIQDAVSAHHLDWIELTCQTASFPEERAAREAALCVREDGQALGDVAQLAGTSLREARFSLEDADPALRDLFLGARPGHLIGPVLLNGEYALIHVVAKVLPSPDAAGIHERAERFVVDRAVEHEITHRIQWRFPM